MKRMLSVTVALGIVLLMAAPCFAENCFDKSGRGLINTATGWYEYPKQIVETTKEHNIAVGFTWGQIKGLGMGVARYGMAIYDIATFYLPPYDEPVIEPEYAFE